MSTRRLSVGFGLLIVLISYMKFIVSPAAHGWRNGNDVYAKNHPLRCKCRATNPLLHHATPAAPPIACVLQPWPVNGSAINSHLKTNCDVFVPVDISYAAQFHRMGLHETILSPTPRCKPTVLSYLADIQRAPGAVQMPAGTPAKTILLSWLWTLTVKRCGVGR